MPSHLFAYRGSQRFASGSMDLTLSAVVRRGKGGRSVLTPRLISWLHACPSARVWSNRTLPALTAGKEKQLHAWRGERFFSSDGRPVKKKRNTRFKRQRMYENLEEEDERVKKVLVVGSSGGLGSTVCRHLAQDLGMRVIGADVVERHPNTADGPGGEILDGFISLSAAYDNGDAPFAESATQLGRLTCTLARGVYEYLKHGEDGGGEEEEENQLRSVHGLDAVICASGGWEGDPSPSSIKEDEGDDDLAQLQEAALSYSGVIDRMRTMNLEPAIASSFVAQHFARSGLSQREDEQQQSGGGVGNVHAGGLFVSIGATAALSPTPGMLGYGLAKVATHHVMQTVGASTALAIVPKTIRASGRKARRHLPQLDNLTVVGLLPTTIDTPTNRQFNPQVDHDTWTKPIDIAKEIGTWIVQPVLRPHSGSLVKVHPAKRNIDGTMSPPSFELVR